MSVLGSVYSRFGGDISVSNATIGGNLDVVGSTRMRGSTFITGGLDAENGRLTVSNRDARFAYLELRAGTPVEVAAVPTFTFTANADDGTAPTLTLTRTNMTEYPVPNAAVLTAFPNNTTDFPSTVNINGALSVNFQASVETAGTDPASPPRANYTGIPIYIFNAPGANGYYDIVLDTIPSSGAVIFTMYDNNTSGLFTQQVRVFTSNGTSQIAFVRTSGKQQHVVLSGAYISGQNQTFYGILSDISGVDAFTLPAAEAAALHAATQQARGFTLQP
jgi:hypothetical protein